MPETGQFSVVTAGALVLGGIAALILAIVVATKEPRPRAEPADPTPPASAEPSADVEYQVDTGEPDAASR